MDFETVFSIHSKLQGVTKQNRPGILNPTYEISQNCLTIRIQQRVAIKFVNGLDIDYFTRGDHQGCRFGSKIGGVFEYQRSGGTKLGRVWELR